MANVRYAPIPTGAAYWDWRYKNGHSSGNGSYGDPMFRKVEWLSRLEGIKSIAEIGCGDFNFGQHLTGRFPDATYNGLDVSEEIVQRNQQEYGSNRIRFDVAKNVFHPWPSADLLLCVDVIFHVTDDVDQEIILRRLGLTWTKYLALSAYEYDGLQRGHINIRKFDPSRFGTPIVREVIEDDGAMMFYIWEKN